MYMYVYIYYNIIIMYNHIAANVLPEGSKLRVLRSSARYHQKSQSRKMRFPETQWSGGHFTHKESSPQGFWWIPGQSGPGRVQPARFVVVAMGDPTLFDDPVALHCKDAAKQWLQASDPLIQDFGARPLGQTGQVQT